MNRQQGKPTVPEVLPLVRAYCAKPGNEMGGSLHIILEDCNARDKDVEFCRQWAKDHDDADGENLAELLSRMSKSARLRLAIRARAEDEG